MGLSNKKEEHYAWNDFARCFNSDAGGCNTQVAAQPRVGLLSEWRDWLDPFDPDHPDAFGSFLDSRSYVTCGRLFMRY